MHATKWIIITIHREKKEKRKQQHLEQQLPLTQKYLVNLDGFYYNMWLVYLSIEQHIQDVVWISLCSPL